MPKVVRTLDHAKPKWAGYQRRPAAQWRRLVRDGGAPIGAEAAGRIARVLNAAAACDRLSDWECCFTLDLDQRLACYGKRLFLTDKQRAALDRLASKLRKLGRL